MAKITVTGSLVQAYMICKRQVWLMSRHLTGNQSNDFLKIGRLLSETSYQGNKKGLRIDGGVIDVVQKKGNKLVIIETKKSSKLLSSGKMQLLFYLYSLKKKGIEASGEIRIPREKKIHEFQLTEENQKEIETLSDDIQSIISRDKPPAAVFILPCKNCSYAEFCWS
jgi:CRISPR-associated exonuclease Cas4